MDCNRGFEYRIARVYTLTFSVLFSCVGGGVQVGHSPIRVLQKV